MKKIFTFFTALALLCAVGCEEQGDDNVNPNPEQPEEKPDDGSEIPDDAYITLNKEVLTFVPDGESVEVKVYSNYEWTLTNNCDWVTTSISGGEASEEGTAITLTADLTYDDREGTIIFNCGKAKRVLVVSQSFKAEKPDDGNGETPDDAYIVLNKENITFSPDGGSLDIKVYSNYEWTLTNNCDWVTTSVTGGEASDAGTTVTLTADLTYDDREGTITFSCGKAKKLLVVSQSLKETIIADENNVFNVPAEGGNVIINYQTTVECEVIILEEEQSWISLAPATRALVSESATLTVAENTTYSERSAVVKVVKVGDNTLFAEYTINQVQNDAIIADENNTFNLKGLAQSINIAYQTNVECEVVIPEEAKSWISFAPTTRALVNESATLNIAENNTGAERSVVVKVVAANNKELVAEYTITQNQRYFMEYTSEGGYTVSPYNSSAFDATIIRNKYIDGKGYIDFDAPITSIGNNAFYQCRSLTSITIPNSVTSIGDYAFGGCTSLTSVTIPDSVTEIGKGAFYDCNSLTNVTIPDSVTEIGVGAFRKCTSLTSFYGKFASVDNRCLIANGKLIAFAPAGLTEYTIPDSVTSIGDYAFQECTSLTSVTIPDSVSAIGEHAFSRCESLTSVYCKPITPPTGGYYMFDNNASGRKIYVPAESYFDYICAEDWRDYVEYIVAYDFEKGEVVEPEPGNPDEIENNQIWYTSYGGEVYINRPEAFNAAIVLNICYGDYGVITFDEELTTIGDYAFADCTSLTSVTIPDSVTTIGNAAFYNCESLTSVTIGNSVTTIGDNAFGGCTSLTNITIPDSVTLIGDGAFEDCDSLTSITIPDSVTSIGDYAFRGCTSLTSATIPDSVTEIGEETFYNCESLTSVTIPGSVTTIGNSAFYNCESLTSITIPDSVTSIGEKAFLWCPSLTSVHITDIAAWCQISYGCLEANPLYYAHNLYLNGELVTDLVIPDSITKIKRCAFRGCTSLTSVIIPDSITEIGGLAFGECTSLTSVTIPDSVTEIGGLAFASCDSLTSVTIPDSVTAIGDYAFENCTSLTNITIPSSVTEIGKGAFNHCTSLTSVTIPDSVTAIGDYAFSGCTSLTSVTIPDSVTKIGNSAFHYCTSLTSVTIPDSVTSIGERAFEECTSLTSATIGNSVTTIGNSAFYNCESLTSVIIPDSVTEIGRWTFHFCTSLTSVTIPDSVTEIGEGAFDHCYSLKEVYCKPTTPPTGGYHIFYANASGRKIYVPLESVEAYKWASYWSDYASDIVGYNF